MAYNPFHCLLVNRQQPARHHKTRCEESAEYQKRERLRIGTMLKDCHGAVELAGCMIKLGCMSMEIDQKGRGLRRRLESTLKRYMELAGPVFLNQFVRRKTKKVKRQFFKGGHKKETGSIHHVHTCSAT